MTQSFKMRKRRENVAPFISSKESAQTAVFETVVALFPLIIWAAVGYSYTVLITSLLSVIFACIFDLAARFAIAKISKESFSLAVDIYPVFIGLCAACVLPINVSVPALLVINVMATVAYRLLGGIISPVAAGYTLLFLISGGMSASFVYSGDRISLPLDSLFLEKLPDVEIYDMLLGRVIGSLGEMSVILLIICYVYLFVRGRVSWEIPLALVGAGVLVAFELAPDSVEYYRYALTHLCSGSLIFGAIFVAADKRRVPVSTAGRLIFGALIGAVSMLGRIYLKFDAVYPTIALFSLITPLFDRFVSPPPFGGIRRKSGKKNQKQKKNDAETVS